LQQRVAVLLPLAITLINFDKVEVPADAAVGSAHDDMFHASDIAWALWCAPRLDDKRRARLEIFRHVLCNETSMDVPLETVKLLERDVASANSTDAFQLRFIQEIY
jgi:hypothetical protein